MESVKRAPDLSRQLMVLYSYYPKPANLYHVPLLYGSTQKEEKMVWRIFSLSPVEKKENALVKLNSNPGQPARKSCDR